MEENTVKQFLADHSLTPKIANKILHNLHEKSNPNMVFNLTQLAFHFGSSAATLSYYVEDPNYPDITLSFSEMEDLLRKYLAK